MPGFYTQISLYTPLKQPPDNFFFTKGKIHKYIIYLSSLKNWKNWNITKILSDIGTIGFDGVLILNLLITYLKKDKIAYLKFLKVCISLTIDIMQFM